MLRVTGVTVAWVVAKEPVAAEVAVMVYCPGAVVAVQVLEMVLPSTV